ncbi:5'/3'-nucleotidase SurE [Sporolituus thermophilus]|uniref:5'-nucleotidase SurE n=1 Tax=Sporolituus thermophilus DSM 23256 TaxID=1123285 RepID=A0A1G7NNS1_9FIRM|nr:5'/3'-nucleotidase SurE [Sporolituus thermophilus]SDF75735.1 5'-nucleotidase /3'-nucleotidase /exopolyphosphatase [Sporolituus thermophilus DSM 23256]
MHILLTNDDGIFAPGIKALWQSLSAIAQVTVVAPDSERSATSQAITVHHPIRVDPYHIENSSVTAWRIGGTPTDCVKLAIEALLAEPPDVVVSGINHGPNLGTDVLYSGTVSAAIEGALHGIPAVAVSLDTWQPFDFTPAAEFTRKLILTMMQNTLPPNTLLNVNVPALPPNRLGGVAVTKLGVRQYQNTFERRADPRGRLYYWMGGDLVDNTNDPDSDIVAVKEGKISVTPIHFDLTNYAIMDLLRKWGL